MQQLLPSISATNTTTCWTEENQDDEFVFLPSDAAHLPSPRQPSQRITRLKKQQMNLPLQLSVCEERVLSASTRFEQLRKARKAQQKKERTAKWRQQKKWENCTETAVWGRRDPYDLKWLRFTPSLPAITEES